MFFTNYNSPIGKLYLISNGFSLTNLIIRKQIDLLNNCQKQDELKIFTEAKNWLNKYFNKQNPKINEISLLPNGTNFQKIIWKILCNIPNGKISTYREIAKIVAKKLCKLKMSAQAVGGAISNNPIPIIIPCHRVVGANNNLVGYSEGLDIKIKLLEFEGINLVKYLK